ncbi:antibiotic biosynthesis monooxygenase family protein [Streptomyces sp. NPDC127074]|uniref:antibiotic biosynthesis monooxygenase family protein n=1 Tax=Streptomyces sp. NPDC127074 TaxID=3347130 RepID=UPI003667E50F
MQESLVQPGPIVSVLRMTPRPGAAEDLAACIKRLDVGGLAVRRADCVGVSVLTPENEDGDVLVVAWWRSEADHRHWQDDPIRAELAPELAVHTAQDPLLAPSSSLYCLSQVAGDGPFQPSAPPVEPCTSDQSGETHD